MVCAVVMVSNTLGMHARAAARFVHAATAFHSRITVSHGTRTVDGKSILGILLLAAGRGTSITIAAEGADEQEAVRELCALVAGDGGDAPCPR